MQIHIGRLSLVFLCTQRKIKDSRLIILLPAYLFCIIMISLWNYADTNTNWQFFYLCEHLNLSAAQIKLCLGAKHWDPNVWTFARCMALICAKFLPNCIRGTLTPKILVHMCFAFNSERIYITLASSAANAATAAAFLLLPGASCPLLLPPPPFLLLFVDCCLPSPLPLPPLPALFSAPPLPPPFNGRRHDFCCRNNCRHVLMIIIVIPVGIVDNNAVPGPHRSLHHRSLPSLLSRWFLHRHCHCLSSPAASASAVDVVTVSAADTYLPQWSWPVAPQKSILVDIYLRERQF